MTDAKELAARFTGKTLLEALGRQPLIEHKNRVAAKFAKAATIMALAPGDVLFEQESAGTDIYLILAGSVEVTPNGRTDTVRTAGMHVGEMSAIDPSAVRSATVRAAEATVVARVAENDLTAIANSHPYIWRHLAREMSDRLRQRVAKVAHRKAQPRLFIASSSEGLKIAEAILAGLSSDPIEVKPWTDEDIFTPGKTNIEALEAELDRADFAALLLSPDDVVTSRGDTTDAPRDNVILELGLFIGRLGRERAIMIQPRGVDLKLPSDLLGVTPIKYDPNAPDDIATRLRDHIASLGPR